MSKHKTIPEAYAQVAPYLGGMGGTGSYPAGGVPIKQVAPPENEDVPDIIFGWWKTASNEDGLLTWGDSSKPNLKLSRNLKDAVVAGAKEVMLFKFDRVGTINFEVR